MTNSNSNSEAVLVLAPGRSEKHYFRDVWFFRELFVILAWRDVTVRYKQTVVGVAWALLKPLLSIVIFSIIFGGLAKLPSDGVPYPIMVSAGLLPWTLFSSVMTESANSLIINARLVSKVYFPRIIMPAAAGVVGLIDFIISLLILVGVMIWYQFMPGWQILLLPVVAVVAVLASLGPSLFISALNVKYRDFRFIVPFIVQFGLYVSPVAFSSSVIPEKWRLLYNLNPMVGVIDSFRWCVNGGQTDLYVPGLMAGAAVTVVMMFVGILYFRATEKSFADVI
ncbi:ABC transporter permease [Parasphingorhabdus sp.]|uniref:ABC transporter permease n=1 Tax=Parasphingorhabdus sp. TaxID=2709688 RepID=UPI003A908972